MKHNGDAVDIFPEEQTAASPPGEYKPKNGSVSGYVVDEAGLLPFPGDEQANVIPSLQFPPHCGGDWLQTNVKGLRSILVPDGLLIPAEFQR